MFYVVNGNIHHTRGDTADIWFNIFCEDGIVDHPYDAIFTVKRNPRDKRIVFQIPVVDSGVNIPHDLTKNLPIGRYVYDLQIHVHDGSKEGKYITIGPFQYHLESDITV